MINIPENEPIDLNDLVTTILLEDIQRYMFKQYSTLDVPDHDKFRYIQSKTLEFVNMFKSKGYNVLEYYKHLSNNETYIAGLKKENKTLRHNISELQKQVNNLKKDKSNGST